MKRFNQGSGRDEVTYQIRVCGRLDANWSDWFGDMKLDLAVESGSLPVTTLTGVMDQSALHGILFRIRDLNLPLISVTRIEPPKDESHPQKKG